VVGGGYRVISYKHHVLKSPFILNGWERMRDSTTQNACFGGEEGSHDGFGLESVWRAFICVYKQQEGCRGTAALFSLCPELQSHDPAGNARVDMHFTDTKGQVFHHRTVLI
jgi:hypothetical protein